MDFVRAGRSILLRETSHAKRHLWFILTDPCEHSPRVVAVMLRTATHFTDTTVILHPGDHPFVHHPSSVPYSTARYFQVCAISRAIREGHCSHQHDMSTDLLQRVRTGLITSPFTINAIRDYCRNRF